jgi:FixJ family two-component response regulator
LYRATLAVAINPAREVTAQQERVGRSLPNTVHVVDDDPSFRRAIQRHLELAGYQVEIYPSAQRFLDQRPDESKPGCILLDARLPDLSGPELQRRLNDLGSTLPIVFITGHADISTTVQALKAGADNFLTKPVQSDELVAAIERALARYENTRGLMRALDGHHIRLASLTPRERQVFELVVRGKANKQIAHQLGTAERTVKAHRQRVMKKMQVQSVAELVSLAVRLGVLSE